MDSDKEKINKNTELLKQILGINNEENLNIDDYERDVFSLSFSVDNDNVVDVVVEWPEKIEDSLVESAATLLFSIDKPQIQELIIQALTNALSSKEDEIPEASNRAMTLWADYESKFKSKPYISPRDVLKIKR